MKAVAPRACMRAACEEACCSGIQERGGTGLRINNIKRLDWLNTPACLQDESLDWVYIGGLRMTSG